MTAPPRPALRYMGGKWRLAPSITRHFPPHKIYVEPFGGGGSVLLRKARSYAEIYNDLDEEVVALFRVLRDRTQAAELARLVSLTPFARDEFNLTYKVADEPIEAARRLLARSFMGYGSTAVALRRRTGFRADSNRSGTTPAIDWTNMPAAILAVAERMQGVVIENRPALSVMARFDQPDTLIYADPPYLHETRSRKRIRGALEHAYKHEMTEVDHAELLAWLRQCQSMVVLSGYPSQIYDDALSEWQRVTLPALADGARARTEVLWVSPAAAAAHGLFGAVA
jgi:DNA adenine methylase